MKALTYKAEVRGFPTVYYVARTAGQVRIHAARTLADCGYGGSVGEALGLVRVRRAAVPSGAERLVLCSESEED